MSNNLQILQIKNIFLRKQLAVRVNGQIRGWLSLIQVLTRNGPNTLIKK